MASGNKLEQKKGPWNLRKREKQEKKTQRERDGKKENTLGKEGVGMRRPAPQREPRGIKHFKWRREH